MLSILHANKYTKTFKHLIVYDKRVGRERVSSHKFYGVLYISENEDFFFTCTKFISHVITTGRNFNYKKNICFIINQLLLLHIQRRSSLCFIWVLSVVLEINLSDLCAQVIGSEQFALCDYTISFSIPHISSCFMGKYHTVYVTEYSIRLHYNKCFVTFKDDKNQWKYL